MGKLRDIARRVQEAAQDLVAQWEVLRTWAPELADLRVGQRLAASRVGALRAAGLDEDWTVVRGRDGNLQIKAAVGVVPDFVWSAGRYVPSYQWRGDDPLEPVDVFGEIALRTVPRGIEVEWQITSGERDRDEGEGRVVVMGDRVGKVGDAVREAAEAFARAAARIKEGDE